MYKLIKEKRDKCAEEISRNSRLIKKFNERLMKPEDVDNWYSILENTFRMVDIDSVPLVVKEFLVWDYILSKYYWRSWPYIKSLAKLGDKNPLSEEDMKNITEIMIEQISKGEHVAAGIPLYSDVWKDVGKEGSPLEKFVRDEHKRMAVNDGFWNSLKQTSNRSVENYACKEFSRIIDYEDFYKYFDFERGVREAMRIPININLDGFYDWNLYMRWYLVQEIDLYRSLEKEKADDTAGKLVAPLVKHLLVPGEVSYDEEEGLRRLVNVFVRGDIVHSKGIQRVLGEIFEFELEKAFDNYYDFSWENLERCERVLVDLEKHVKRVWEKNKDSVNLSEIPDEVKKYVPGEVYQEYVQELRTGLEEMKRFNIELFKKWMDLRVEEDIKKTTHGRVRNKAFEIYFSQKVRPSRDCVERISRSYSETGSGHFPNRLKGFLFADLLFRNSWSNANEILMGYDYAAPGSIREFYRALSNYFKMHGPVLLDKYALKINACYPKYNKIKDFKEEYPKLFKIK